MKRNFEVMFRFREKEFCEKLVVFFMSIDGERIIVFTFGIIVLDSLKKFVGFYVYFEYL